MRLAAIRTVLEVQGASASGPSSPWSRGRKCLSSVRRWAGASRSRTRPPSNSSVLMLASNATYSKCGCTTTKTPLAKNYFDSQKLSTPYQNRALDRATSDHPSFLFFLVYVQIVQADTRIRKRKYYPPHTCRGTIERVVTRGALCVLNARVCACMCTVLGWLAGHWPGTNSNFSLM